MDADALETSHPISVEVENPTQIAEIFDAISYTKGLLIRIQCLGIVNPYQTLYISNSGSAVIRMMNHFLGEKTFRQGVTNYLKQKSPLK